jgi:phage terminase large subunit-like protein
MLNLVSHIIVNSDPACNIKADKEKSTEKIDGAVAAIMGPDRAIRGGNESHESVYNSRGILFYLTPAYITLNVER